MARPGWMLLPFCLAILLGSSAHAQDMGTVTGRVTDRTSGAPIENAQVLIGATNLATRTDASGTFTLTNVPAGTRELRVRLVGFAEARRMVQVAAGQTVTANVSLERSAIELDPIVVNAITGQERRSRELGANVASIGVQELEAPITKLADVLTARTPGVNLQGVAGTVGTGQRIRIRGANSLSLSNEPLVYVDGVLISSGADYTYGVGGQSMSRFNDINPEDIESIEVLKGPAASALYGTAAANGVLLIKTRRGHAGAARWSAYTEAGEIQDRNDYPANFLSVNVADPGAPMFTASGAFNFTAYERCLNYVAAEGACEQDTTFVFNTLRDPRTTPFEDGFRVKHGVNVAGGTQQVTYYLSGDLEREQGVIPYNTSERINLRANMQANVRDDLNMSVTTGYVTGESVLPNNDNSIFSPLINGLIGGAVFFPNIDDTTRSWRNYGFNFTPEELANLPAPQELDRFTIGLNSTWTPRTWLSANVNVGFDYVNSHDNLTLQPNLLPIAYSYGIGFRTSTRINTHLYTANASTQATWDLAPNLLATTTVGGSYQRTLDQNTYCYGAGLVPGIRSCGGTAELFEVDEGFAEIITIGGFVQQTLAWNDRLFLAAALRGDDNSAFGEDFGFVVYPSANVSWVIAEEPWFPQFNALSTLRLRAAVGTSGLRPAFRDAVTLFAPVSVTVSGADVPGVTLSGTGNIRLEPERSTEYEGGFDVGFLDNRIALDFTYYRKKSEDALIERNLAPSLGLTATVFDNLGSIENRGTETQLRALLIDRPDVTFDVRLAATTLRNKILSIGSDVGVADIIFNRGNQRHTEGFPAGAFFSRRVTWDDADGNGLLAVDEVEVDDSTEYFGPALPTSTQSLGLDLTLRRFIRISALFDRRAGNKQLNYTEFFRCRQPVIAVTAGGCPATGDPDASLREQAALIGSVFYGSNALYIEDADFIKFRELSVTLTAPETWAGRLGVRGLALTVAGRNLATWTDYTGLDPEINESGGAANFTQGEFNTQPPVRTVLARLQVNF